MATNEVCDAKRGKHRALAGTVRHDDGAFEFFDLLIQRVDRYYVCLDDPAIDRRKLQVIEKHTGIFSKQISVEAIPSSGQHRPHSDFLGSAFLDE